MIKQHTHKRATKEKKTEMLTMNMSDEIRKRIEYISEINAHTSLAETIRMLINNEYNSIRKFITLKNTNTKNTNNIYQH